MPMSCGDETPNPYNPPKALPRFTEESPSDLELRVAELERKISQSWFLRSNIFARVFAVCGHFLLGYVILLVITAPIILLLNWLSP